jgi:hypothetical protein
MDKQIGLRTMKSVDLQIESYLKKLRTQFKKSFAEEEDTAAKDIARIEVASRLLQISEFCFFRLAYEEWCGCEISESDMEPIFTDYIFMDEVPHWARLLARTVLSSYFHGYFDSRDFNIN